MVIHHIKAAICLINLNLWHNKTNGREADSERIMQRLESDDANEQKLIVQRNYDSFFCARQGLRLKFHFHISLILSERK